MSLLAVVTVLQFTEHLTDRQAADGCGRLDWKYCLSLELTDPGFDFSVLSEFWARGITLPGPLAADPSRQARIGGCTSSARGRQLTLRPREIHQVITDACAGQSTRR